MPAVTVISSFCFIARRLAGGGWRATHTVHSNSSMLANLSLCIAISNNHLGTYISTRYFLVACMSVCVCVCVSLFIAVSLLSLIKWQCCNTIQIGVLWHPVATQPLNINKADFVAQSYLKHFKLDGCYCWSRFSWRRHNEGKLSNRFDSNFKVAVL